MLIVIFKMKNITFIILLTISTASFATATLYCNGDPYLFVIHYSLSDGAQNYELIKTNKSIKKGHTKELIKFKLSWPEPEQSIKNKLTFAGKLNNKISFNGFAKGNNGNIIINKQKYRFKCDWAR